LESSFCWLTLRESNKHVTSRAPSNLKIQNRSEAHHAPIQWYRCCSSSVKRSGRLTVHLHLAPRLSMSGVNLHFHICPHGVHRDDFTFLFFDTFTMLLLFQEWPRGLKCVSAAHRLLGLRVRTLAGAWMAVSYECCVLSCREL
jgi:hypothetical protein